MTNWFQTNTPFFNSNANPWIGWSSFANIHNLFSSTSTFNHMPLFSGFNNYSTDCSFFNPSYISNSSLFSEGYDNFSQPLYSSTGSIFGVKLDAYSSNFEQARQKAYAEKIKKSSYSYTTDSKSNSSLEDTYSSANNIYDYTIPDSADTSNPFNYIDNRANKTKNSSENSSKKIKTNNSNTKMKVKQKLKFDGIKYKSKTKVKRSKNGLTAIKTKTKIQAPKNSGLPSIKNTSLLRLGYNSKKGKKLADTAMKNHVGFIGYCAKYVKTAIRQAGLGDCGSGHGYQMAEVLSKNKNFKQISTAGVNLNSLPAGCVLVYGRGVAGYSSQYGHVEVTNGCGQAVSDGITNNLRPNPTAIFIPV